LKDYPFAFEITRVYRHPGAEQRTYYEASFCLDKSPRTSYCVLFLNEADYSPVKHFSY
jgi:hypothetical protein